MKQARDRQSKLQETIAILFGSKVVAVKSVDDGSVYASLPHLCAAVGLELEQQEALIIEHADLWRGYRYFQLWVALRAPGLKTTPCLRADLISPWLACAEPDSSSRERARLFQRTAAGTLQGLFEPNRPSSPKDDIILVEIVTFDEPPPPEILEKLERLVSALHSDTTGNAPPPETLEAIDRHLNWIREYRG